MNEKILDALVCLDENSESVTSTKTASASFIAIQKNPERKIQIEINYIHSTFHFLIYLAKLKI
jgi:hypothetical protein